VLTSDKIDFYEAAKKKAVRDEVLSDGEKILVEDVEYEMAEMAAELNRAGDDE
jgi:hypothetical protein